MNLHRKAALCWCLALVSGCASGSAGSGLDAAAGATGAGTGGSGSGGSVIAGSGGSGSGGAVIAGSGGGSGAGGDRGGPAGSGGSTGSDGGADARGGATVTDGGAGARGTDGAAGSGVASDVIGKVTVGYQGWFTAPGDGAPFQAWWHYDRTTSQPPSPGDNLIVSWPDMTDFTTGFQTGFANLNNGRPATLFSSFTTQTVDTHFRWMQESGIDTAALQRFSDQIPTRNAVAVKVAGAAEAHGRKFYIMYDISGWTTFQNDLKTDWTNVIKGQLQLTNSPAYAMQNGKPVVCIWGIGFGDRPGTAAASLDVINFFKAQGVYVIGGVPLDWLRADGGSSKQGFGAVYDAFNMISPWMVGVIGNIAASDAILRDRNQSDFQHCQSLGIAYQPCVLPGDLSLHQRVHGDFMWHQFANMFRLGAQGIYVSMFDEFNEGNQIAKTAATLADRPSNSTYVTLDEDGTACSSDYYMRLTGDGGRMLKGQIPFTTVRPTPTR